MTNDERWMGKVINLDRGGRVEYYPNAFNDGVCIFFTSKDGVEQPIRLSYEARDALLALLQGKSKSPWSVTIK